MGKRKQKNQVFNSLSKKQKKHLKDFGEEHPFHDIVPEKADTVQVLDLPESPVQSDAASEDDEEPEQKSAYQKLLTTLSHPAEHEDDESVADDDDDDDDDDDSSKEHLSEEDCDGDGEDEQLTSTSKEAEPDEVGEKNAVKNEGVGEHEFEDKEHESKFCLENNFGEGEQEGTENPGGQEDKEDPFILHHDTEISEEDVTIITTGTKAKSQVKWPRLGTLLCSSPLERFGPVRQERETRSLAFHKVLETNWTSLNQNSKSKDATEEASALQLELLALMGSYRDVYFPESSPLTEGRQVRSAYCLHALNHVLKSTSRILAHNAQMRENHTKDNTKGSKARVELQDEPRDQGLTRPKVLILVPFRDGALRVVQTFLNLLETKGKHLDVSHKKRFKDDFGEVPGETTPKALRPDDYTAIFSGNIDDHFRIGVSIVRRNIRLYAPFYSSDIIIASPLGLRTVLGAEGEANRDFDFLSSIEMLVVDQADVFLMQNWEHLLHVMKHLNLQPLDAHGVNFSRVRMWNLNNWAKYYRQTLVFSAIQDPQINNLFSKHCFNYRGQIATKNMPVTGSICQVLVQLPHVFQRMNSNSIMDHDARFQFFVDKVLPQYRDSVMSHTLIYVPSYFDYVRLRNYMKKTYMNFSSLCEYSTRSEVSRARHFFQKGDKQFLLFTERFHFYKRYTIKGIQNLIFYGLPTYPHFYSEVCNMLQAGGRGEEASWTCTALYSRYDAQRLTAITGAKRAAQMLQSEKPVHLFITGEKDM